jgi:glycosyltransferase involved in cell wall biosynthesis
MKCLIVVPSLERGGAEVQAVNLANGLARRGHTVHIFTFVGANDQLERLDREVEFHYIPRKHKFSTGYIFKLGRIIEREEIDVIHCVIQFTALVSWIATRRLSRRPPIIAAIHTTTYFDFRSEVFDAILYQHILKRMEKVVFVSRFQKEHWIARFPSLAKNAVVVYNGIEVKDFEREEFEAAGRILRSELAIANDKFVFCCIARFRPEKGHLRLLKSFAKLPPGPYLLLAGDGPLRSEIEKLIRRLAINERVKLLGDLSDVRPLLAACNASILASTSETFSMAMLESLAMRAPMLAPRVGGLPEAIIDGETGLLFDADDDKSLERGMSKMTKLGLQLERMGRCGETKVRREFGFDRMIEESESVLLDAIDMGLNQ